MHVAIHLYMLHHCVAICLEPAIKVMKILYAAHLAGSGVKQFGRYRFRQWVITLFLPARHKVVAIARNHAVKLRNLVGAVLEVGIHRDDHIPLARRNPVLSAGDLP